MEKLYDTPGLWIKWIRLQWPSAKDRIPENPQVANACIAVINAGYQAADMKDITDALVRDLMDGKCDDLSLKAKFLKEAKENVAANNAAIAMLEREG